MVTIVDKNRSKELEGELKIKRNKYKGMAKAFDSKHLEHLKNEGYSVSIGGSSLLSDSEYTYIEKKGFQNFFSWTDVCIHRNENFSIDIYMNKKGLIEEMGKYANSYENEFKEFGATATIIKRYKGD